VIVSGLGSATLAMVGSSLGFGGQDKWGD